MTNPKKEQLKRGRQFELTLSECSVPGGSSLTTYKELKESMEMQDFDVIANQKEKQRHWGPVSFLYTMLSP